MTERAVFINCPFTPDYRAHFRAIIFTVIRSGVHASLRARDRRRLGEPLREDLQDHRGVPLRHPRHLEDGARPRVATSSLLICRWNWASSSAQKRFGGPSQRTKKCIIFDTTPYRYQQFISDIAGQDIHAHDDRVAKLIEQVATWFRDEIRDPNVPGGRAIAAEYEKFMTVIPDICAVKQLDPSELTFQDYRAMAAEWIVAESSTVA